MENVSRKLLCVREYSKRRKSSYKWKFKLSRYYLDKFFSNHLTKPSTFIWSSWNEFGKHFSIGEFIAISATFLFHRSSKILTFVAIHWVIRLSPWAKKKQDSSENCLETRVSLLERTWKVTLESFPRERDADKKCDKYQVNFWGGILYRLTLWEYCAKFCNTRQNRPINSKFSLLPVVIWVETQFLCQVFKIYIRL